MDDRLPLLQAGIHQPGQHILLTKNPQQIVVEAEVEARQTGITLTPRTPTQLVVDAAAFVPFGAEYEQASGGPNRFPLGQHFASDPLDGGITLRTFGQIGQFIGNPGFEIAAKLNVRAAPGHVGGNRHRPQSPGLRNDMRFLFMEPGIEHAVRNAFLLQEFRQKLRLLDGNRANQGRLPFERGLPDRFDDGTKLVALVLVEFVVDIDALDRNVGWNLDDVQLVDFIEFRRLGRRCPGHAAQLWIHAEIILEGHAGERLVFRLDRHPFLRFNRLMQAIGPAPAVHHATGEFVDDDDFPVAFDIVDVPLEHHIGAQRLIEVVNDLGIFKVVQVFTFQHPGGFEHPFDLLGAVFGQDDRLGFLILLPVALLQLLHHGINRHVEL